MEAASSPGKELAAEATTAHAWENLHALGIQELGFRT